jgi:hypothetical protein
MFTALTVLVLASVSSGSILFSRAFARYKNSSPGGSILRGEGRCFVMGSLQWARKRECRTFGTCLVLSAFWSLELVVLVRNQSRFSTA